MPRPPSEPRPTRAPRALAVVPARLASTRLPRKMLLRETGSYLFEHVARAVQACPAEIRVVIAADGPEIEAAAREVGLECVRTAPELASGTDRVHAACRELARREDRDFEAGELGAVVLNVQGDEPELDPAALVPLLALFDDPEVELASLWAPLADRSALESRSIVKVVCDQAGWALYFSRAAIPSGSHASQPVAATPDEPRAGAPGGARQHLGVYAFRPRSRARFCALPRGTLERAESLEQLRWLEAGGRIRMAEAPRASSGIDTPEDYRAFVSRHTAAAPAARGTPGTR